MSEQDELRSELVEGIRARYHDWIMSPLVARSGVTFSPSDIRILLDHVKALEAENNRLQMHIVGAIAYMLPPKSGNEDTLTAEDRWQGVWQQLQNAINIWE